jgi:hypothetical protein
MGLITGITGAAADLDTQASPEVQVSPEMELAPEVDAPVESESVTVQPEPGPGLEERSYSLVGRALRFVMQTVTPGAWQSVIQEMAGKMPSTITLEPMPALKWQKEAQHRQFVEELRDQGFVEAGIYYASSMDANLHLLVNEAYDIRAVVYEREDSGIVLDLVTLFGDGTAITYVNRDDPGYEQSPLHPNVYRGNVPVFELLDVCLRERPQKARLPESPATAARLMVLEYEFGAKRLRGEPVNPVEIADAYLEVIERFGVAETGLKEITAEAPPALPSLEQVPHPTGPQVEHPLEKTVAAQGL